jgi:hypothetical protein
MLRVICGFKSKGLDDGLSHTLRISPEDGNPDSKIFSAWNTRPVVPKHFQLLPAEHLQEFIFIPSFKLGTKLLAGNAS